MRDLLDLYTNTFAPGWPPPNVITYGCLVIGCWAYALACGGAPERIGSTILVAGTLVAWATPPMRFQTLELDLLAVDILLFISFLTLALKADRFWPLWLAAFQVITLAGHVVRVVDADILGRTYAFMIVVWSYPMSLLVIIGTWRHQKRLARFGVDRAWSTTALTD